jgi:hypothetical protein
MTFDLCLMEPNKFRTEVPYTIRYTYRLLLKFVSYSVKSCHKMLSPKKKLIYFCSFSVFNLTNKLMAGSEIALGK